MSKSMICTICYQKTTEILYPILTMSQFPGYLKQFGINNKIAFKSNCYREHIHMRCAVFIKGLKWVKEQFSKQIIQIDYVCFGLELVNEGKHLKNTTCATCTVKKPTAVLLLCEQSSCGKAYHVDCVMVRKKRVFWDRRAGKLHIYCNQHTRGVDEHVEEINWEAFDSIVTHIVHSNMVSRDQEYQKYIEAYEASNSERDNQSVFQPEDLYFDGQRNLSNFYQKPALKREYTKPSPMYQIDYSSKVNKQQQQALQLQQPQRPPSIEESRTRISVQPKTILPMVQVVEIEESDPIDKPSKPLETPVNPNQEDFYSYFYKKPNVDQSLYATRASEEPPEKSKPRSQPQDVQKNSNLPEDAENDQQYLKHQKNKLLTYLEDAQAVSTAQRILEEERDPQQVQQAPRKIRNPQPKQQKVQQAFVKIDLKQDDEPQVPIPKQSDQSLKRQRFEDTDEIQTIEPVPRKNVKLTRVVIQPSGSFPVYPGDDEDRDEKMKQFWNSVDQHYFPSEYLPDCVRLITDHQVGLVSYDPEKTADAIPSLQYSSQNLIATLFQQSTLDLSWIVYYDVKTNEEPGQSVWENMENIMMYTGEGDQVDISPKDWDHLNRQWSFIMVDIIGITAHEARSCFRYQQFLNQRKPSLTSQLDVEYQYLMDEYDSLQDELQNLKRDVTRKLKQHQSQPIQIDASEVMDQLRWCMVANFLRMGFDHKDESALKTFEITYSPGFKKVIEFYPPQATPTKHQMTDCQVCFFNRNTDINPVVYCDKCGCGFHKQCYGISVYNIEGKDILCDLCTFHQKYKTPLSNIQCSLCKQSYQGIPLKLIKGNFFHVQCVFAQNFSFFEDLQWTLSRKVNLQLLEKISNQYSQQCQICQDTRGYKYQCIRSDCYGFFHLLCAYFSGIEIQVKIDTLINKFRNHKQYGQLEICIKCYLHDNNKTQLKDQMFYRRFTINYLEASSYKNADEYLEKTSDLKLKQFIETSSKLKIIDKFQ